MGFRGVKAQTFTRDNHASFVFCSFVRHTTGDGEFHVTLDYEFTPMGTVDAPTGDTWFIHEPSDIEVAVDAPEVEANACDAFMAANCEEAPAEAARAEYRRTRL